MSYPDTPVMTGSLVEMTEHHKVSLRELCSILFASKYKMVLFSVLVIAATVALTLRAPKVYRSEAKLLVRLGRESVTLDPTATTGQTVGVVKSLESEVRTELEILRSRRTVEKAVDSIGPEVLLSDSIDDVPGADEPMARDNVLARSLQSVKSALRRLRKTLGLDGPIDDRDKAVLAVENGVSVTTEEDTGNIIRVHFEAHQPELAQRVVAELIDAYMEERITIYATAGSYAFFAQQCDLLQQQLGELEQRLEAAANGSGASSINDELRVTLDHVGSLEKQVDLTESAKAASQARVQKLTETLAAQPQTVVASTTTGFANVAADAMRERLYELQLREQELASKYSDQSRQVQEIRRQIAEAQALLNQEKPIRAQTTTALNNARQQTESALSTEKAQLSALEAEAQALRAKLTEARARLTRLNETAAEVRRVQRDIGIREASYHRYAECLEQVRIDDALDAERISNITVVQAATLAVRPIRPRTMLQLALGVLLSVFGSFVIAFACEYLNHTIRNPREVVRKLRLPALAYVPRVRADTVRPVGVSRFSCRHGGVLLHDPAVRWDIPAGVKDHFEALAQRIVSATNGSPRTRPRLIGLTGSRRGEGVSVIAANLAAALARENDGNVLLIDGNITHPSLHKVFDIKANAGLADILCREDAHGEGGAIVRSPVENLELLPAGTSNGCFREAFRALEWARFLKRLKKEYRHVIVDLPALHEVKWTGQAASLCDGVVLVVEANKSSCEAVLEAKEQLLMWKAKILGVVLNKRRFPVPRRLYNAL